MRLQVLSAAQWGEAILSVMLSDSKKNFRKIFHYKKCAQKKNLFCTSSCAKFHPEQIFEIWLHIWREELNLYKLRKFQPPNFIIKKSCLKEHVPLNMPFLGSAKLIGRSGTDATECCTLPREHLHARASNTTRRSQSPMRTPHACSSDPCLLATPSHFLVKHFPLSTLLRRALSDATHRWNSSLKSSTVKTRC